MPKSKPPSPVRVGMLADDVLKMRGRSVGFAVAAPEWVVYGKSAKWHYADCSVVLERTTEDGPYRVTEVEPIPAKAVLEVEGDGTNDNPENSD